MHQTPPDTTRHAPDTTRHAPDPTVYNMWGLTWFWDDLKAIEQKCWSDDVQTDRFPTPVGGVEWKQTTANTAPSQNWRTCSRRQWKSVNVLTMNFIFPDLFKWHWNQFFDVVALFTITCEIQMLGEMSRGIFPCGESFLIWTTVHLGHLGKLS